MIDFQYAAAQISGIADIHRQSGILGLATVRRTSAIQELSIVAYQIKVV